MFLPFGMSCYLSLFSFSFFFSLSFPLTLSLTWQCQVFDSSRVENQYMVDCDHGRELLASFFYRLFFVAQSILISRRFSDVCIASSLWGKKKVNSKSLLTHWTLGNQNVNENCFRFDSSPFSFFAFQSALFIRWWDFSN